VLNASFQAKRNDDFAEQPEHAKPDLLAELPETASRTKTQDGAHTNDCEPARDTTPVLTKVVEIMGFQTGQDRGWTAGSGNVRHREEMSWKIIEPLSMLSMTGTSAKAPSDSKASLKQSTSKKRQSTGARATLRTAKTWPPRSLQTGVTLDADAVHEEDVARYKTISLGTSYFEEKQVVVSEEKEVVLPERAVVAPEHISGLQERRNAVSAEKLQEQWIKDADGMEAWEHRRVDWQKEAALLQSANNGSVQQIQPSRAPPLSRFETSYAVTWLRKHDHDVRDPLLPAKALLLAISSDNYTVVKFITETYTCRRGSGLCRAAKLGRTDIVRILLDGGWAVDSVDKTSCTALHAASEMGHLDIVQELIELGANVDAESSKAGGKWHGTPIQRAIIKGHTAVVEYLLMHGADVEVLDDGQRSLLEIAIKKNLQDVVKLLLAHGANTNVRDTKYGTLLHRVADTYDAKSTIVVALLLEHGAEVDAHNARRETTLHRAALDGKSAVVDLLLAHGAYASAVDDEGETPLHKVARKSHYLNNRKDIVFSLLKRGADLRTKNHKGRTMSQLCDSKVLKRIVTGGEIRWIDRIFG
jgi:ankyrin repeat protein